MNFRRALIFAFAIFSLICASCSDMTQDAPFVLPIVGGATSGGSDGSDGIAVSDGGSGGTVPVALRYISVKGIVYADGAFPEEIAALVSKKISAEGAGISKSAFPQPGVSDLQGFTYKITAVKVGDESVFYEAEQSDISVSDAGLVSYGVNVPVFDATVQYKIKCEAYLEAAMTSLALKGQSAKFAISRDDQAASVDTPLHAIQESGGLGSVKLSVALASGLESSIDSATMTIEGLAPVTGSFSDSAFTFASAGFAVPCGAHSARFSFKNGSEEVYAFWQIVNVYKNLETKIWLQNGAEPYFTTTADASGKKSTACSLNAVMLESWKISEFFVDATRSDDPSDPNYTTQSGTFINPCLTFDGAVSKLVDPSKDYTIFINGTVKGAQSLPDTIQANSLLICGNNGQGVLDGNFAAAQDGGSTLAINAALKVTLQNIKIKGGKTNGSGGGIFVGGDATLVLCDGVEIEDNLARTKGGGIYMDPLASIEISGNVKVFGNTNGASTPKASNIYLPDDVTITVNGALKSGSGSAVKNSKIGVSSQTAPTIAKPVPVTSGYGWKTGGANAGVPPGRYFVGDTAGVTYNSNNGEAILGVAGGKLTEQTFNGLKIYIDKNWIKASAANKKINFSAKLVEDDEAIQSGTEAGQIQYSCELLYKGEKVPAKYYNYTAGADYVTLDASLPQDLYTINVYGTYEGNVYCSGFDVAFIDAPDITASLQSTPKLLPENATGRAPSDLVRYVLFGDYPQTIKDASVAIYEMVSTEYVGRTFYYGSDGAWYVKCLENGYSDSFKYSNGTWIVKKTSNRYSYFKLEPIKWLLLANDFDHDGDPATPGKWLLHSDACLDVCPYFYYTNSAALRTIGGNQVQPYNYEYSQTRAFFNGLSYINYLGEESEEYVGRGFLQSAFDASAQALIATTKVDNSLESTGQAPTEDNPLDWYSCNDTDDKVFTWCVRDLTAYYNTGRLTYNSSRTPVLSDYSLANYVNPYQKYVWFRSAYTRKYTNDVRNYIFACNDGSSSYALSLTLSVGIAPMVCVDPQ